MAEKKITGSQRRIPGLQMFEYNINDGTVQKVEIETTASGGKRVQMRPGCVYFQALNQKNAMRKAERFFTNASTETIADIINGARKEAGLDEIQP